MTAINPDQPYTYSRTDLLQYEDLIFANITKNTANYYYINGKNHTIWGTFLKGVASEQARFEFMNQYSLYGRDPVWLTPPDIRRRRADVLFVNRNYPETTRSDQAYKQMLMDLERAYRLGATVQSISQVITAYTGEVFYIDELFKGLGRYYDQSDRNAIKISVYASSAVSSQSSITNDTNRIRAVTEDLYNAIDLAKPAHVGINLTTIFGSDENIGQHTKFFESGFGISDELRIILQLVEEEPLEPMLEPAPFLDPSTPDTRLGPEGPGLVSPRLLRAWEVKDSDGCDIQDLD